jgi:hypothetical protein
MPNRTFLSFGSYCEFETTDALPINWLALFVPEEFISEPPAEAGASPTVLFRTGQARALARAEATIRRARGRTPAWSYLRPLEILREELRRAGPSAVIELDVTQLAAQSASQTERLRRAPADFASMVDSLGRDPTKDLDAIDKLVASWSTRDGRLQECSPDDLAFILLGAYWGDPDREDLYAMDYFDEKYWTVRS